MNLPRAPFALFDRVMARLGAGELGKRLAAGAAWTFLEKGYVVLIGLGTNVLLTRTLGAELFGAWAFAIVWTQVLVFPAVLGMDRMVLREVAKGHERGRWGRVRGLLRFAHSATAAASIFIAVAGALLVGVFAAGSETVDGPMRDAFRVAMVIVPVHAFMRLRQVIVHGSGRVALAQAGDMVAMPTLFLAASAGVILLAPQLFDTTFALLLRAAATAAALGWMLVLSRRMLPREAFTARPRMHARLWLRQGLPMMGVALLQVLNQRVDILLVGSLLGSYDAGIYAVANRGAMLLLNLSFAVNAAVIPTISALHARRDPGRMERLLTRAARLSTLAALPFALAMVLFGEWFLLLFGPEFVAGLRPLIILSLGQVLVVAFGPVSSLLMMTAYEGEAALGAALGVGTNIGLNLLLIPALGLTGAAVAMVAGQVVGMAALTLLGRWRLGVVPAAFVPLSRRWRA